ncbi:MAG TPA: chromosome condensation regulator, partial [Sphaerochaetaceae bacterium]|nr:chromosome condensation regulator [Sphaerochaetaceae bacterium]
PVHITDDVVQVSAGNKHSLFMKSDGTVWAMGDDTGGQLATGEPKAHATFVQVATGATTIETGDDHSLYIDTDGVLWGTGSNTAGQLDRALPGMITEWRPLRESVSMVSAGRDFTLFIQSDLLGATGSNEYGQIASWGE